MERFPSQTEHSSEQAWNPTDHLNIFQMKASSFQIKLGTLQVGYNIFSSKHNLVWH